MNEVILALYPHRSIVTQRHRSLRRVDNLILPRHQPGGGFGFVPGRSSEADLVTAFVTPHHNPPLPLCK